MARPLIFLFILGFAYNVSAKKKVASVYSEPLLMVRVKYDFKNYSFVIKQSVGLMFSKDHFVFIYLERIWNRQQRIYGRFDGRDLRSRSLRIPTTTRWSLW